jgi:hypothetical protein
MSGEAESLYRRQRQRRRRRTELVALLLLLHANGDELTNETHWHMCHNCILQH